MTYRVTFETAAINSAAGFLADDAVGLQVALAAIDQLAEEPRPTESAPFGSPDIRRLRVGSYRVLYRIADDVVAVIHLGRAGKPS